MKKIIAVVLSLILLMSVLPVYGFGASDTDVVPVSVACKDNYPISLKEIENRSSKYFLFMSDVKYEFEVTLSDGRTFTVINVLAPESFEDAEDYIVSIDGKNLYMTSSAYIDCQECLEIVSQGGTKVPVYILIYAVEYNLNDGSFKIHKEYTLTAEKEIVPQLVEIEPVSGMPEYVYDGANYANFENAVFKLTYWDGTVKYETAEYKEDEESDFYLDGMYTYNYIDFEGKNITVGFLDDECTVEFSEIRECPFSAVEITDCIYGEDSLLKISYRITYKDGSTKDFSKELYMQPLEYRGTFDNVDGYTVYIGAETLISDGFAAINVYNLSDDYDFDIEYEGFYGTLLGKIVLFFRMIIDRIFNIF